MRIGLEGGEGDGADGGIVELGCEEGVGGGEAWGRDALLVMGWECDGVGVGFGVSDGLWAIGQMAVLARRRSAVTLRARRSLLTRMRSEASGGRGVR